MTRRVLPEQKHIRPMAPKFVVFTRTVTSQWFS
jgi:hypothetical protein